MGDSGGRNMRILRAFFKVAYALIGICLVFVILFFAPKLRGVTVQEILQYTPANPWLAAGLIMLLYSIKSIVVFFPLLALYIAVGTLFSVPVAVFVNILGITVVSMLPYFLGRQLGSHTLDDIAKKNNTLKKFLTRSDDGHFVRCFVLRVINILPGDIVSFVLGAAKTPTTQYLSGSLLGLLPVLIPATILGTSLQTQSSESFLIAALCIALLIIAFLAMYFAGKRHLKKMED